MTENNITNTCIPTSQLYQTLTFFILASIFKSFVKYYTYYSSHPCTPHSFHSSTLFLRDHLWNVVTEPWWLRAPPSPCFYTVVIHTTAYILKTLGRCCWVFCLFSNSVLSVGNVIFWFFFNAYICPCIQFSCCTESHSEVPHSVLSTAGGMQPVPWQQLPTGQGSLIVQWLGCGTCTAVARVLFAAREFLLPGTSLFECQLHEGKYFVLSTALSLAPGSVPGTSQAHSMNNDWGKECNFVCGQVYQCCPLGLGLFVSLTFCWRIL